MQHEPAKVSPHDLRDEANAPSKRRPAVAIGFGLAVVLTLGACLLILQGGEFGPVNWALGRPHARAIGGGAFVAFTFGLVFAVVRFARTEGSAWLRLIALVLLGASLQFAFILAQGGGRDAIRSALYFECAHREMIQIAVDDPLHDLVSRYEQIVRDRKWTYPVSKPPGALLVYRGVALLSRTPLGDALAPIFLGKPEDPRLLPRWRADGLVFTLFPLLTFLTVVPLFALARRLIRAEEALLACILYTFVPSVLTIPLYLDGAVYPLVAVTAAWLVVAGAQRESLVRMLAGGVAISAGLFITFSMLGIAPVIVLLAAAVPLVQRDIAMRTRALRAVRNVACVVAGAAAFHLVPMSFGYDPLLRYERAMHLHRHWWDGGGRNWVFGSTFQFLVWLGPALTVAFALATGKARPEEWRKPALVTVFTWICVMWLAATAIFSHARVEAQRLWLFWVPFVCLAATPAVARWEKDLGSWVVPTVVVLQMATAFALKSAFVFW